MRYLTIGDSFTAIPVIGQGCGGGVIRDASDLERRAESLRHGIDCGLTLLDTAEAYHQGRSETAVGLATKGRRDHVFIASKVSPEHLGRNELIQAAEASLRRLQTDYIDLYQIHWSNRNIRIEETMDALGRLVSAGKVRHVGVCNFTARELRAAEAAFAPRKIVSLQAEYNLFDRSVERSVLPSWSGPGRVFLAYSPLEQGSLAVGDEQRSRLEEIAVRYQATPAQVALAWIVSHPGVLAIPRSTGRAHIGENAAAANLRLRPEDIRLIDESFASQPESVAVDRIQVVTDGMDNRAVYKTVEEALANPLGLTPSPRELAAEILDGEFLKPVRVRPARNPDGPHDFELIEGRLRYWAWVIAFNGRRAIDVLVRRDASRSSDGPAPSRPPLCSAETARAPA